MTTRLLLCSSLRTGPHRTLCRSFSKVNFPKIRASKKDDIAKIVEVQQRSMFLQELASLDSPGQSSPHRLDTPEMELLLRRYEDSSMKKDTLSGIIDASLSTFLLHVESRVASSQGLGFYTIGPCGEELLSAVGANLRPTDPLALHYRHVAVSISRQLGLGQSRGGRTLEEIITDRARGYVCSTLDPVTGGKHCAIGGSPYDFYVTSTLASQASPAVGRALAIPLAAHLQGKNSFFPKDSVSVVSLGEGSTNNAHFLAALNLAEYNIHMKRKCPLVLMVSDNQMCISLKDDNWINQGATSKLNMKRIEVDGNDVLDVHRGSEEAMSYARKMGRPVLLLIQKLNRRFGHAATDRQLAYLSADEISQRAQFNNIFSTIQLAHAAGEVTVQEMVERYQHIWQSTEKAFDQVVNEPKITDRKALIATNAVELPLAASYASDSFRGGACVSTQTYNGLGLKRLDPATAKSKTHGPVDNMRKHMTRLFDEALSGGKARNTYLPSTTSVVYLGEDVRHGGYYLVTEGLFKKHPTQVHDFPPDETTLLGAGQGFAQAGLLPIVEIPYAKYLDCGADMFYEIALTYWLTNTHQKHGMLLRLQGFDKGVFGGNFHTHNDLHIPVGLDVVCYSNGGDYVRGMRHCLQAAEKGRVVMTVDCTDLLNRRHLGVSDDHSQTAVKDKDDHWLTQYPSSDEKSAVLSFEDVIYYPGMWDSPEGTQPGGRVLTPRQGGHSGVASDGRGKVLIVSYGNGLPTSLQAMKQLVSSGAISDSDISVVDCPYLSRPPQALVDLLSNPEGGKSVPFEHVIFADVCKESAGMPFAGFVVELQKKRLLPHSWRVIGAQNTYNPLGQTLTFLTIEDIVSGVQHMRG